MAAKALAAKATGNDRNGNIAAASVSEAAGMANENAADTEANESRP